MDQVKRFHVVQFCAEGTIEIIPSNWLVGFTCLWPPITGTSKIKRFVQMFVEPAETWKTFQVTILKTTSTYEKAERKLQKALYHSELSSDCSVLTENRIPRASTPLPLGEKSVHNVDDSRKILSAIQASMEAFQRSVFRVLEDIREDQRQLRSMIAASISIEGSKKDLPGDCPKFPCVTPEELAEFDAYLANGENFSLVCRHFGTIGGSSTSNVVGRILHNVMTNQLSMMYNWRGTGGLKLKFSQFKNICKMLMVSVREHSFFEKATDQEVENCIKKWLVYAKDREGGRSHRKIVV